MFSQKKLELRFEWFMFQNVDKCLAYNNNNNVIGIGAVVESYCMQACESANSNTKLLPAHKKM